MFDVVKVKRSLVVKGRNAKQGWAFTDPRASGSLRKPFTMLGSGCYVDEKLTCFDQI